MNRFKAFNLALVVVFTTMDFPPLPTTIDRRIEIYIGVVDYAIVIITNYGTFYRQGEPIKGLNHHAELLYPRYRDT